MGSRLLRTSLRAAHLVAVAGFFGGCVFGVERPRIDNAAFAVGATGLVFLAYEVRRAPVWLFQLRGVLTCVKIAVFLGLPWFWDQRVVLLTALIVIGTFVSHMPGKVRYYSLFHRRVIQSDGLG
jgi:hypothetical protein